MRDAFLKQLEELHKMLAEMGNLCESMIDGAYEALMNMDREQAAKDSGSGRECRFKGEGHREQMLEAPV